MEKVRKAFYIEEELLGQVDALLPQADVRSRNEFVNQVNKVSETEQYSPIRADFFLAILCLRGKASLRVSSAGTSHNANFVAIAAIVV